MVQITATKLDPEYDAIARGGLTEKQIADLEAMPARLPLLPLSEIFTGGARIRAAYDSAAKMLVDEMDEEDPSVLVMMRAASTEYLLRQICIMMADELQRRRTGVAPRAKRLN